jgi:hypothetical protein
LSIDEIVVCFALRTTTLPLVVAAPAIELSASACRLVGLELRDRLGYAAFAGSWSTLLATSTLRVLTVGA